MKLHLKNWQAIVSAIALGSAATSATDLVWIGGTGNWNAAGNWSPAQVPTSADNAWITNNGIYAVTVPAGSSATSGSLTIGGGNGTQTLAIDRATLTLNGASLINPNGRLNLLVSQSELTGPGDLTMNGTLNWINGTVSGTGTIGIGSGGVLVIGSAGVTLGRTLKNSGGVTWGGGNLSISDNNTFNNLAGGTFDITADGRLAGAATTPINNSGLFRLASGSTGTTITAPFNNSGNLQVLATTLNLNFGGTHAGTMTSAPGATLNLGGGSHILAAGSLVAGGSVLTLSGGATLSANGTFGAGSTLNLNSGIVTLAATCDVTAATVGINGANCVVNYNSAGSVRAVNVSQGTLGGTSPVNVTGPLTLSGGTVTNPLVTANGGLTINGNAALNGTKLINPTNALWSAGNFTGANGAAISNLLGASFINSFDGNAGSGAGATPLFVNAGLFQKTNGTAALGTTSIDFQFINTGIVEVQTNTLRYNANEQTAGLTVLDGGDLTAQAQPLQFLGGSLVGTGLVTVANTQNLINSAKVSPGLPLGELDVAGNYQQTATGTLEIELGGYAPGTEFDLVTVTGGGAGGVATLGGTLSVALTNGFSPTNGATFTFLTALNRVGAFANFNYPSNDIGMQVSYDTTSATLKITNLKPVVANPIVAPGPGTYGAEFSFQFPANTFTDPDNDTLTYTASGLPPGISFVGSTRTISGIATEAGVFSVSLIANDSGTPNLSATNTFDITISPATLTITADPATKMYGASDPLLNFTVGGLQLTDTTASVLSGALERAAGENVAGSPYAITQGTLTANSNYTISFTGNTLTITPAALTVTASAQSKKYGVTLVLGTTAFTSSGLQNGETVGSVTLATSGSPAGTAATAAAGLYTITPSAATGGTFNSANYTISYATGTLTVNPADLTVTAIAQSKTYGGTLGLGTSAFTASGLQNGETIGSVTLTASGSPAGTAATAAAGPYTITPSAATGGTFNSANYTISYATGTLTVNPADLTVTAIAQSKTYGGTLGLGTSAFTASGLQNGETIGSVTLTASGSPAGTAATAAAGPYTITPSAATGGTFSSANYTISYATGTLTVNPADLTVTASAQSKTYGATLGLGSSAFTTSGLQNGETVGSVTLTASGSPAGTAATAAAGPYTITPSAATGGTFSSANYTITYATAALTVNLAVLSVTADNKTKTFGDADPAFTVTYAGFVNAESPAVLGGTLTLTRAPGENVGSYLITPTGLISANYSISFNTGTLTITAPAPLILTLTNAGTTDVIITWSAVSNATYRVQYKGLLIATNWTDLSGDILAQGRTASKTDGRTTTNRFYRIQVLP